MKRELRMPWLRPNPHVPIFSKKYAMSIIDRSWFCLKAISIPIPSTQRPRLGRMPRFRLATLDGVSGMTKPRAWIDYGSPWTQLSCWRSKSGYEVDFLLDEELAIEVKATARVSDRDLVGLKALREEGILLRFIVVCRQERPELLDGIEIMPWEYFLQALWAGSLLKME